MMESDWAGDVSPTLQTQKQDNTHWLGTFARESKGLSFCHVGQRFQQVKRESPVQTWLLQEIPG